MNAEATDLPGVLVIRSPVHTDDRGFFTEVYHAEKFAAMGLPTAFAQDNHSRSGRNVLRGLHFQLERPQAKLIRVVSGQIFDVAVDIRRSSPTYAQWVGVTLAAGDGRQMWIPEGFAHGFFVLSEFADVTYKCTTPHDARSNGCIRWDDPEIAVRWPIPDATTPTISAADAAAPTLASRVWFK